MLSIDSRSHSFDVPRKVVEMTKAQPLNDRSLIDRAWIGRRIAEGRSQGHGDTWRPWLEVRDVPSLGWSYRLRSWLHDRVHHLLSTHERNYYLTLLWSSSIIAIYEQVALLDIDETLDIANSLGIRYPVIAHPSKPKQRMLPVLSSDFRLTVCKDGRRFDVIRTVKPADRVLSRRVQQKFDIERRYWSSRGLDWAIVTEASLPQPLVKNVWLVYNHHDRCETLSRCNITADQLEAVNEILMPIIQQGCILNAAALACDRRLGLPAGTSLTVVYHLIASRRWPVDMHQLINPGQPLPLLKRS